MRSDVVHIITMSSLTSICDYDVHRNVIYMTLYTHIIFFVPIYIILFIVNMLLNLVPLDVPDILLFCTLNLLISFVRTIYPKSETTFTSVIHTFQLLSNFKKPLQPILSLSSSTTTHRHCTTQPFLLLSRKPTIYNLHFRVVYLWQEQVSLFYTLGCDTNHHCLHPILPSSASLTTLKLPLG